MKSEMEAELAKRLIAELDNGIPARDAMLTEEETAVFRGLGLLTGKPLMVLSNVSEKVFSQHFVVFVGCIPCS
jgi:ribosome-binding ATPase YchF (GTP1/OBG family)